MGKEIMAWSDEAMYEAQPMLKSESEEESLRIFPKVFVLSATPDPLGTCAADMRMYRGDPVMSLADITQEEREWAWDELSKTALNTPLEGVSIKFMIEAVTRSFTHQMVRQRVGAYYVQESLRFAVKRGIAKETALPPSIVAPPEGSSIGEPAWEIWNKTIGSISDAYNQLVDAGIPAEDARGLLPHAVTTRIIYHTNLRALFEHAGNRLCTQAQFEWRHVFMGIMTALKEHETPNYVYRFRRSDGNGSRTAGDGWQWSLISEPKPHTFTPICYRLGRCAFKSELDRGCSIRARVEAFERNAVPSDHWAIEIPGEMTQPIYPHEWMADAKAGMTRSDWGQERPQ